MERDTVKKEYCVYCHVTPSGKRYIGISKDPVKRWNSGKGYVKNYHFFRAINKYGWENIDHDILESGLTAEEAKTKERELIEFYKTTDRKNGYNLRDGGDGSFSSYSRALMSKHRIGNTNSAGRELSSETKTKISDSLKDYYNGCEGTFLGKHHTAETILKLKNRSVSDETRKRMSKNHANVKGKNNPAARAVYQYSVDGVLIHRYDCITQAARENGIDNSSIGKCCHGKKKTAGGYVWKFANDVKRSE